MNNGSSVSIQRCGGDDGKRHVEVVPASYKHGEKPLTARVVTLGEFPGVRTGVRTR